MTDSVRVLKDALYVWRRKAQWLASNVKFCDEFDDMDNIWRSHAFAINKVLQLEVELAKIRPTKLVESTHFCEIERKLGLVNIFEEPKFPVCQDFGMGSDVNLLLEPNLGDHFLDVYILEPKLEVFGELVFDKMKFVIF